MNQANWIHRRIRPYLGAAQPVHQNIDAYMYHRWLAGHGSRFVQYYKPKKHRICRKKNDFIFGKGSSNRKREYRKAKYSIDGKTYSSCFVASVIAEHFEVKNQIIIAKVKSMWEELYRNFQQINKLQIDEDFISI